MSVLELPCRACGAKPGEMCEGGAMPEAGVPHPARVSDYMASVADGLREPRAFRENHSKEGPDG